MKGLGTFRYWARKYFEKMCITLRIGLAYSPLDIAQFLVRCTCFIFPRFWVSDTVCDFISKEPLPFAELSEGAPHINESPQKNEYQTDAPSQHPPDNNPPGEECEGDSESSQEPPPCAELSEAAPRLNKSPKRNEHHIDAPSQNPPDTNPQGGECEGDSESSESTSDLSDSQYQIGVSDQPPQEEDVS